MTAKHFSLIAAVLNDTAITQEAREAVAEGLAEALAETNPRFDRERFLRACGVSA